MSIYKSRNGPSEVVGGHSGDDPSSGGDVPGGSEFNENPDDSDSMEVHIEPEENKVKLETQTRGVYS